MVKKFYQLPGFSQQDSKYPNIQMELKTSKKLINPAKRVNEGSHVVDKDLSKSDGDLFSSYILRQNYGKFFSVFNLKKLLGMGNYGIVFGVDSKRDLGFTQSYAIKVSYLNDTIFDNSNTFNQKIFNFYKIIGMYYRILSNDPQIKQTLGKSFLFASCHWCEKKIFADFDIVKIMYGILYYIDESKRKEYNNLRMDKGLRNWIVGFEKELYDVLDEYDMKEVIKKKEFYENIVKEFVGKIEKKILSLLNGDFVEVIGFKSKNLSSKEKNDIYMSNLICMMKNFLIRAQSKDSIEKEIKNNMSLVRSTTTNTTTMINSWYEKYIYFIQSNIYKNDLFSFMNEYKSELNDVECDFIVLKVIQGYEEVLKMEILHEDLKNILIEYDVENNKKQLKKVIKIYNVYIADFGSLSSVYKQVESNDVSVVDRKCKSLLRLKNVIYNVYNFLGEIPKVWNEIENVFEEKTQPMDCVVKLKELIVKHNKYCEFDTRAQKIIIKLEKRVSELETKCDNLKTKCDNLKTKYDNLKTEHDDLKTEHNDLKTKYDNLQTEHDDLKIKYDNLKTKYDNLERDHLKLKRDYMGVVERLERLEANANKSENFEFSRRKIISKVCDSKNRKRDEVERENGEKEGEGTKKTKNSCLVTFFKLILKKNNKI